MLTRSTKNGQLIQLECTYGEKRHFTVCFYSTHNGIGFKKHELKCFASETMLRKTITETRKTLKDAYGFLETVIIDDELLVAELSNFPDKLDQYDHMGEVYLCYSKKDLN